MRTIGGEGINKTKTNKSKKNTPPQYIRPKIAFR